MPTRFFAITFLMTSVSVVSAQTSPRVDVSGLSQEQIAALNNLSEQLRKQPENTLANLSLRTATPNRIKEWTEAGEAAGKAVAAFTKEIGIAADQFLKTDVGRTAFYVVIWRFGGDKIAASLLSILLSVVIGGVLITIWWRFTRRFAFFERRSGTVTLNENPLFRWLGFNKKEIKWEKDDEWIRSLRDDNIFWATFWVRVLSAAALAAIVLFCWPKVNF